MGKNDIIDVSHKSSLLNWMRIGWADFQAALAHWPI